MQLLQSTCWQFNKSQHEFSSLSFVNPGSSQSSSTVCSFSPGRETPSVTLVMMLQQATDDINRLHCCSRMIITISANTQEHQSPPPMQVSCVDSRLLVTCDSCRHIGGPDESCAAKHRPSDRILPPKPAFGGFELYSLPRPARGLYARSDELHQPITHAILQP